MYNEPDMQEYWLDVVEYTKREDGGATVVLEMSDGAKELLAGKLGMQDGWDSDLFEVWVKDMLMESVARKRRSAGRLRRLWWLMKDTSSMFGVFIPLALLGFALAALGSYHLFLMIF